MEEAVRIGIHTMYFDGHGHGGGSKDWYTYCVPCKDWYTLMGMDMEETWRRQ